MKTKIINTLITLALSVGVAALPGTTHAEDNNIIHHVSGAGLTLDPLPFAPNFLFRTSISAWQRADGSVGGTCVVVVEGLFPDITTPALIVNEITCLRFEGNKVYFTMTCVKSTKGINPVGSVGVGYVVDNDGTGPDQTYSGPAFYLAGSDEELWDCAYHESWFLPPGLITTGNFIVR